MSFTLSNLRSDQKLAAFGSFSIFCLSVTHYPRLIHCRKQPSGYQEVASQDENREVLSPEAVSDLSTDTHHMVISVLFCKDYHPTASTQTEALIERLRDHQGSFEVVPPGFQKNKKQEIEIFVTQCEKKWWCFSASLPLHRMCLFLSKKRGKYIERLMAFSLKSNNCIQRSLVSG